MIQFEADELTVLLAKEQDYILGLKRRWGVDVLTEKAENALRMGKRTELLGELQFQKQQPRSA